MSEWTVKRAKQERPEVPAEVTPGKVQDCDITGSAFPFAALWLPGGGYVEVAWSTIVHVLNRGTFVRI